MTRSHENAAGRPVHPECRHSLRPARPCTCAELWAGWHGDPAALPGRIDELARRECRRRDWGDSSPPEDDLRGFWRESERLRAVLANSENRG